MGASNGYGTTRRGLEAEADDDRRATVGEPLVRDFSRRDLDRGWAFNCPFYGRGCGSCGFGSLHEGFESADHARAGWIAHVQTRHPGLPHSWPLDVPGKVPPAFAGTQVVTRPHHDFGFRALAWTGALIGLTGVRLLLHPCRTCPGGHHSLGETCPVSMP